MFSYYFDPTYVLVIIAFLLTLFASMGVKSTFSKYNNVRSSRGITAASAARQILDANGLHDFLLKSLYVDSNVGVSGTLTVNQVDSTQMASDEDVLAASSQLMKRNKHVYKELSK